MTDPTYQAGRGPFFAPVPFDLIKDPDADSHAIAVYAALRMRCDFGKGTVSGAKLSDAAGARLAGCGVSTFQRRRAWLREKGWIEWKSGQGNGVPNVYVVHASLPGVGQSDRGGSVSLTEGSVTGTEGGRSERPTTNNPGITRPDKGDVLLDDPGVQEVFAFFNDCRMKAIPGSRPLKLTEKVAGKIRGRFRDGLDVKTCKAAAVGMFASEHHRSNGFKWATAELCYRNQEKTEGFARAAVVSANGRGAIRESDRRRQLDAIV